MLDEPKFRKVYNEYANLVDKPIKFKDWLIRNNFGILQDTQFSIMRKPINALKLSRNRNTFVNVVRQGDILLTIGNYKEGTLGHAAIMATDKFVLEMRNAKKNKIKMQNGRNGNNIRTIKENWFDMHKRSWITVYRYPDSAVADTAARWAYRNYYNPIDGPIKTIHITYKITWNFLTINPSYCSKLVLHAYYFGTNATFKEKLFKYQLVFPMELFKYFRKSLKNMGSY